MSSSDPLVGIRSRPSTWSSLYSFVLAVLAEVLNPPFCSWRPYRKSPILPRTRNSADSLLRRFLWAYSSGEAIFGKSFRSSGHVTNPRVRSSHGSAPSVKSHMLLLSYKTILSNENTPLYMEVCNTYAQVSSKRNYSIHRS